jgi:hypothetical protein
MPTISPLFGSDLESFHMHLTSRIVPAETTRREREIPKNYSKRVEDERPVVTTDEVDRKEVTGR